MDLGVPSAAHFIFIPVVLMIGVAIGWVLGSGAARDAYLAELKKRERKELRTKNEEPRTKS